MLNESSTRFSDLIHLEYGARDLKESLLLQLRERGIDNNLVYRIVEEQLETLDKKSFLQLAKTLGVSLERIQEAMEVIKTLSPRPAFGRFTRAASAIVPDLIVDKVGDEYVISHNDRNIPAIASQRRLQGAAPTRKHHAQRNEDVCPRKTGASAVAAKRHQSAS